MTHATLAGLLGAHMAHIPFENFDVLLGREVRLDPEGLQAKLVKARRGGYCFEHSPFWPRRSSGSGSNLFDTPPG
jgi:N-hydroxyarylamine O-acetyltransferase